MKTILLTTRLKALFGIGILAIGLGLLSKKVINYPYCSKDVQKVTFLKKIN